MTHESSDDAVTLLESAYVLRSGIIQDPNWNVGGVRKLLLGFLNLLILDEQARYGMRPFPYANPLERQRVLEQLIQSNNQMMDALTEQFANSPTPLSVGLAQWIWQAGFHVVKVLDEFNDSLVSDEEAEAFLASLEGQEKSSHG